MPCATAPNESKTYEMIDLALALAAAHWQVKKKAAQYTPPFTIITRIIYP